MLVAYVNNVQQIVGRVQDLVRISVYFVIKILLKSMENVKFSV
jgi:hypothetical protein